MRGALGRRGRQHPVPPAATSSRPQELGKLDIFLPLPSHQPSLLHAPGPANGINNRRLTSALGVRERKRCGPGYDPRPGDSAHTQQRWYHRERTSSQQKKPPTNCILLPRHTVLRTALPNTIASPPFCCQRRSSPGVALLWSLGSFLEQAAAETTDWAAGTGTCSTPQGSRFGADKRDWRQNLARHGPEAPQASRNSSHTTTTTAILQPTSR